jgi:hypothetical protein
MAEITDLEVSINESVKRTSDAVTASPSIDREHLLHEAQPTADDAAASNPQESLPLAHPESLDIAHPTSYQSELASITVNAELEPSSVEVNGSTDITENVSDEKVAEAGASAPNMSNSAVTTEDSNPTVVDIQAFLETLNAPKAVDVAVENNGTSALITEPLPETQPIPTPTGLTANQELGPPDNVSAVTTIHETASLPLPPRQPAGVPPVLTTGANGLPPPPIASFQQLLSKTPQSPSGFATAAGSNPNDDDNGYFPPELEGPYEEFLREERANLNEGNWEKFPDGSRLFIGMLDIAYACLQLTCKGNLPTEKASKRDVFKKFCRYGKLGQISMKQAFGFVQFLEAASCSKAKDEEQDSFIRGRRIRKHLAILQDIC